MSTWSFLTNHGVVLTYLGRYPDSTGLAIAQAVGVTERAARKIVADLLSEGYIERERVGRRNRYRLNKARSLPYPGERMVTVGELLALLWREHEPNFGSVDETSPLPQGCDAGSEEAARALPTVSARK